MLKTRSGRRASQNEYELTSFIAFLKEKGVTRYAEIGARHGDTFWTVATSLPAGSKVVAIDLPGGLWGTTQSESHLRAAVDDLKKRGYDAHLILGNSQEEATQEAVAALGPYDAILIDGDHTLEGVTRDWELYDSLAPMIAFHDIVGTGQAERVLNNPVEVPILWERLKAGNPHREFIDKDSKMGIGVILD